MYGSLFFLRVLQSEIALVNVNKLTIMMGDFNLTKIDWLNSRTVLNHTPRLQMKNCFYFLSAVIF